MRPLFLLVLLLVRPACAAPFPPLPAPPSSKAIMGLKTPRIPILQKQIAQYKLFSAYRELIQIYEQNGFFEDAASLHCIQAGIYRSKGFEDAAIIEENRADEISTDLRLFLDVPTSAKGAGNLYTGAPIEPILGCYLGAFIDRDDALGPSYFDENWQSHRTPEQFEAKTSRKLGSHFMYLSWGQKFPHKWVETLKKAGVIPHIAWEPQNLAQVKDDNYLRSFARECKKADWPVIFRYASEMNGFWTPYHGNPRLYIEKFRLVHRVLHEEAPLAATMWTVGNPPLKGAFDYYPGDDGCDWVGVNFYSVPFHENRRDKPAWDENPLSFLDPIYRRFAAKKPIAICEYGASHQAAIDNKQVPDFAQDKLSLVYGALPLLYPRVKLVDWFDMNSIRYPSPGKTLSNYLLTENPQVLAAWKRETASPWFLGAKQRLGDSLPLLARPLNGQKIGETAIFRVWAKSYSARPKVWVQLDGKTIYWGQKSGAHEVALDAANLSTGSHILTALLYDDQNRFVRKIAASFQRVAPVSKPIPVPSPTATPTPMPTPEPAPALPNKDAEKISWNLAPKFWATPFIRCSLSCLWAYF